MPYGGVETLQSKGREGNVLKGAKRQSVSSAAQGGTAMSSVEQECGAHSEVDSGGIATSSAKQGDRVMSIVSPNTILCGVEGHHQLGRAVFPVGQRRYSIPVWC